MMILLIIIIRLRWTLQTCKKIKAYLPTGFNGAKLHTFSLFLFRFLSGYSSWVSRTMRLGYHIRFQESCRSLSSHDNYFFLCLVKYSWFRKCFAVMGQFADFPTNAHNIGLKTEGPRGGARRFFYLGPRHGARESLVLQSHSFWATRGRGVGSRLVLPSSS